VGRRLNESEIEMRSLSIGREAGRHRRAWVAVALFLGLGLALPCSSAAADSYHDFLCEIPYGPSAGSPAPTEDVSFTTVGGFSEGGSTCESANGEMMTRMDGGVAHSASGEGETARFTAPSGLSISGFTLWRYEQIGNTQSYGPPVASIEYGNASSNKAVDACAWINGCSTNGSRSERLSNEKNRVSASNLGAMTYIQWFSVCADTGGSCPTGPDTEEDVYAADIDLVDETPPTVSNVSGPLVSGATLTGKQAVSFNASDGQSGVYGGSLVVDGDTAVSQILNTNDGACESLNLTTDGQRSFDHAKPCEGSLSASLSLNTSQLTAGQHSIELIVEDAAGNQTIAYDGTITVGGSPSLTPSGSSTGFATVTAVTPQIGPGSPAVLRGPANGVNASDQATLTARWRSTAKALRTSSYGAADRITGRLTAPGGVPISDAELDVFQTPAYVGAKAVRLATVGTGATGDWTLALPRGVSSSTLRFEYRSHQNDTIPVTTVTLTLRVHAGIALKIAPRISSVGHRIFFGGVVHGTPIPEAGKQLVLEARSGGGEWIQFDTIRTDAKGRYHASYRFKFPGPVTYQFRVLSRYEAGFPYLDGTSNVIDVHEH
jgi:hypothetical protein